MSEEKTRNVLVKWDGDKPSCVVSFDPEKAKIVNGFPVGEFETRLHLGDGIWVHVDKPPVESCSVCHGTGRAGMQNTEKDGEKHRALMLCTCVGNVHGQVKAPNIAPRERKRIILPEKKLHLVH